MLPSNELEDRQGKKYSIINIACIRSEAVYNVSYIPESSMNMKETTNAEMTIVTLTASMSEARVPPAYNHVDPDDFMHPRVARSIDSATDAPISGVAWAFGALRIVVTSTLSWFDIFGSDVQRAGQTSASILSPFEGSMQ